MSYSANDHAGDTVDLVCEVIEEAIEQTETDEAEERLREMKHDASVIKQRVMN